MTKETQKTEKIQIIGEGTEEEKQEAREFFKEKLFEHKKSLSEEDKKFLDEHEIKKTKEQENIIEGINDIVRKIGKEIGLDLVGIPADNIHILDSEAYQKIKGVASKKEKGASNFGEQGAVINRGNLDNKFKLTSTILHEILHLEGIFVAELLNRGDEGKILSSIREGISTFSPEKNILNFHIHGGGLHQAIVSHQQKKSHDDILNLPELKKEKKYLESKKIKKLKEGLIKKYNISENEIIWIDEKDWDVYGFPMERKTLDFVMDKIQKKFPEKYENKEEVFKEFLKAQFVRGHLLKIEKLVEESIGKHSFRALMAMEDNDNSAINTYELLRNIYLDKPKRDEMERMMKRQKMMKKAKSKRRIRKR